MKLLHVALALALSVDLLPCWAQNKEAMLKGKAVTESALIEALSIDLPDAPTNGATRSFGSERPVIKRRAESGGSGKASLLMTFTVDSADLTPDTTRVLDTVAKALQSDQLAGFSFQIEGHADPRGGEAWNQQLSQRRAAAVVGYLVKRHGILPERLAPVGKGSTEPINIKQPDAPENRRVKIITNRV